MKTKICSSFWGEPDVENTDPETRLTALWLETNERVSLFGYAEISPRRFEFETGLPAKALAKTFEALPKRYVLIGAGYWVVNYIREQFGEGESLSRNNMFRAITRSLEGCACGEVVERVCDEYPIFSKRFRREGAKPLASPTQGQSVSVGVRAGASVSESAGARASFQAPTLEEWLAEARARAPQWPEEDARAAWAHYEAAGWVMARGKKVKKWQACVDTCHAFWRKQGGKNLVPNIGRQAEFDPHRPNAHTSGFEDVTLAGAPAGGGA